MCSPYLIEVIRERKENKVSVILIEYEEDKEFTKRDIFLERVIYFRRYWSDYKIKIEEKKVKDFSLR